MVSLSPLQTDTWHLEYKPFKRVRIQYAIRCDYPDGKIKEWEVLAALAPNLPQQTVHQSRLFIYGEEAKGATSRTVSEDHQRIFWVRCPVQMLQRDNQLVAMVEHDVTSAKRQLVPGPPLESVSPLPVNESWFCLKETPEINFNHPPFQEFLTKNALRLDKDESILSFGRRVHHFVRTYMRYNINAPFGETTITQDCQTRDGHCGNYSRLVVGIMRANNIPARLLFGHWLLKDISQGPTEDHTQSEFYIPEIGWVMADSSVAVPTGGWKPEGDIEEGFANDSTCFITFHLHGPLLLPTHNFGPQKQAHLQGIYTPAVGGDWSKMKMTTTLSVTTLRKFS